MGSGMQKDSGECNESWALFVRRHWLFTLLMVVIGIIAGIVGILGFLWVVNESLANGLVPALIGEWSVSYCIGFFLTVLFWELILVASWMIPIGLIVYFGWYRRLPAKERKEYEGKKQAKNKGDIISLLCTIIWLIIVWTAGKWDLAFQEWTFNDWVYTWLTAFIYTLIIVGIPAIIYVLWKVAKE